LSPMTAAASAEDDDEEEELTAAEVIVRMTKWWINEKFSPDLLPHQTQLVDCLLDQIKQMEANLKCVARTDFRAPLHKLEVARVTFVVASYLRTRLTKIEKFIWTQDIDHLLAEGALSREEATFARSHKKSLEEHLQTLAMVHMPGDFGAKMPDGRRCEPPPPKPDTDAYIFASAECDCPAVVVDNVEGQEVDLAKESQHVLRYSSVSALVRSGSVRLM